MSANRESAMRAMGILLLGVFLAVTPAALAHGELEGAAPGSGENVRPPVRNVTLTFSEEPADQSVIQVRDGCGRKLVKSISRNDTTLTAALKKGVPGTWKVVYDVLSAEDGHESSGDYVFNVKGKTDCSRDKGGDDDGDDTSGQGGGDVAQNASDEPASDSSSFPIAAVIIGAVALIGIAVIVRLVMGMDRQE